MGDNIFHVICILERIICYENPPTDKTGGGGAQVLKRIAQGPDRIQFHQKLLTSIIMKLKFQFKITQ